MNQNQKQNQNQNQKSNQENQIKNSDTACSLVLCWENARYVDHLDPQARANFDLSNQRLADGGKAYSIENATSLRRMDGTRTTNPKWRTDIMAKMSDEEKKAAAEKREAEKQEAGEKAASAIPTVNGQKIEYRKANTLSIWDDNPRTLTPDAFGDAALSDSMATGWNPQFPAVIFPDGKTIQGNRRLQYVDGESKVPCLVYTGDNAGAMLLALNDTGTGIVEKGLGDITRALVGIMTDLGLTDHTVVSFLWSRSREILHRISPASKNADSVQEAQKASRGALQAVAKIAKLPTKHQEGVYDERNAGTRKAKMYPNDVVSKMSNAKTPEEVEAIFSAHVKAVEEKADPAEQKAPNKLTGKLIADRKLTFSSDVFKALGALFDKPGEGEEERDALAELAELDATCASRQ